MNKLKIVACIDKERGIGKDGKLLYRSKRDMELFKRLTVGRTVVMGRKTWESLDKPLAYRNNVIISSKLKFENLDKEIWTYGSVKEFLRVLFGEDKGFDLKKCLMEGTDVYIIGGAKIYKQFLPYCDTLYLTEVDAVKEADKKFPRFAKRDFNAEVVDKWEEDGLQYKLVKYTRRIPVEDSFKDDLCE